MRECSTGRRAGILAVAMLLAAAAGSARAEGTPGATAGDAGGELTVAAGGGLIVWDDGPWVGHVRFGGERTSDRGLGIAIDGGWLWFGENPSYGVGTASPSLVLGLGRSGRTSGSLRGGYTMLFRDGVAHAAHAGFAVDHHLRSGGRVRLEVRDTFLPQALSFHVVEVAVGVTFPMGGGGRAASLSR
jgi:hypothetical protein